MYFAGDLRSRKMESNIRIKSAVKRALEGESIRIVYLGGAVTAGNIPGKEPISENYAKLSFDHFCSKTKNKMTGTLKSEFRF